jgi:thiol-disulfide isomerase/thioredoxin
MLAALFVSAAAYAADKLEVGDSAPGLDIEEWVKGDEVSIQEGKVYIIEFWATWCGPCRASIPHLTKLQEQFDDDLVIVGVSAEETSAVRPFVKKMGKKMEYTVAVDRRRSTSRAWLEAAGINGIPAAFIVDKKGKIAFIGNPHPRADGEDMEGIIKKVMSGRYDPKLEKQAQPLLDAAAGARKTRTWRMAEKYYTDVIDLNPMVFAEVALDMFEMKLLDQDNREDAYKYANEKLINGHFAGDPGAQQMLAEKIVLDPIIPQEKRDYDVAMTAAQNAMTGFGERDPEGVALVAMVHYHRGEIDEAIKLQKKAYFLARPKFKEQYKRVLADYREALERTAGS